MRAGRPTFQIEPERLKALRNEAGMTQNDLAIQVNRLLGKPALYEAKAVKHYQKVERTGKTSASMAHALASALSTTIEVLQGGAPDGASLLELLEKQLQAQLATGRNQTLIDALRLDPDRPKTAHELAFEIAQAIEAMQMNWQENVMQRLVSLTGWTAKQLMQSAAIHGHWLISSTPNGYPNGIQIVVGSNQVVSHIHALLTPVLCEFESDTVIEFREDLPWMQLEVKRPRQQVGQTIARFVKCLPCSSGLQWINPNWRDRFWLNESLKDWSECNANFVSNHDAQIRPRDIRKVRMLVEELSADGVVRSSSVVKSDFENQTDAWLCAIRAIGESHGFAVNWLIEPALDVLAPRLKLWPTNCWTAKSGAACIDFRLSLWKKLPSHMYEPDFPSILRVSLIEEDENSQNPPYRLPWRETDVQKTLGSMMQRLRDRSVAGD